MLAASLGLAAACGGGSATAGRSTARRVTTTTSTTAPAGTSTSATVMACGGPSLIAAAVKASPAGGLNQNPDQYEVANVSTAQSDATWARFDTLPAPGQEGTYQGGNGIAHCDGNAWSVTDFGTAEVGCPGGAVTPPPPAVRSDLGIDCP